MAQQDDFSIVPMVYIKFTEGFEAVDHSYPLNGPYDITTPLQAMQMEAGSKGLGVIVQVACVPLEMIFGPAAPEDLENDEEGTDPTERPGD